MGILLRAIMEKPDNLGILASMKPFALFQDKFTLDLLALLAGCLLPFAFAPYHMYFLAVICPAVLLTTWLSASAKRACWRGFIFGLGFFSIAVYWVFISIHTYGNTPVIIAFIITAGFILLLSGCIAVNGLLFRWLFPKPNYLNLTLGFASSWVLLEWLRGWLFTGFPWVFLGYSQIDSPLAGFAPVLSVYGVSFMVALSSGLLINAFRGKKAALYSILLLIILWAAGFGLSNINWTKPIGKPVTVSLIQGDIAQSLKWDPEKVPNTLALYHTLTLQNINSDIIVWPEAAIPIWLSQAQDFTTPLNKQLLAHRTALLAGVPIVNAERTEIYNAATVLGNGTGTYYKRHLVPFGEYVPLESLLRGLIGFFDLPMSNLSPGAYRQDPVILAGIPTAVAICYEIAYDVEFMNNFPAAKLIVTISDDSWFGQSWAAEQQTQISQMRSLETGRYQLVATNDGLTALIDNKGKILKSAPRFQVAILKGEIYNVEGDTPITMIGIYSIIVLLLIGFIVAILFDRKPNK